MDRILSDEAIKEAYVNEAENYPSSLGTRLYYGERAVANAQDKNSLKAVGEWLTEICPHTTNPLQQRKLCNRCRNELIGFLKRGEFPSEGDKCNQASIKGLKEKENIDGS